jgi:5'-nucleotidase
MNILISNDDGYFSDGIRCLKRSLLDAGHNVFLIAPDRDNSACGMSITLRKPVTVRKIAEQEYAATGTPVDCVGLALGGLIEEPIDLVVSGINNGANLSDDVFYSGTAAAAMEARRLRYPSIAMSIPEVLPEHYETAAYVVNYLINKLDVLPNKEELAFLNVNVPDVAIDDLKGIKAASLGRRDSPKPHEEEVSLKGARHCWLGAVGNFMEGSYVDGSSDYLCDHELINLGYASVTPIRAEWLHQKYLQSCEQWLESK